jgi:hypothetical protein
MRALVVALVFLAGCAGTAMDLETLKAEGYQRTREVEHYELWVKETQEAGRTVRVCLAPKIEGTSYNWYLTVLVDGKDTWSYQSLQLSAKPGGLRRAIDCAASPTLPEGRLTFEAVFRYR